MLTITGPSYEYYPVWVQPDSGVRFAKVRYDPPKISDAKYFIDLRLQEEIRIELRVLDFSRMDYLLPLEDQ